MDIKTPQPKDPDGRSGSNQGKSKPRPRFVPSLRKTIRRRGLAYATEKTYVYWVVDFIHFHGLRHPSEMAEAEVSAYLTHLSEARRCAVNTQRLALNALVFLYQHHLERPLGQLAFRHAKKPQRMPEVFSHTEAMAVLGELAGVDRLIGHLLYGAGLRVAEALSLRVKDIDFDRLQITVRNAKGNRDRATLLPETLADDLRHQIDVALKLHAVDLAQGFGRVELPDALAVKNARAATSAAWQFVFPSASRWQSPVDGVRRRHHRHYTSFARSLSAAIRRTGIRRRASSHTFRHSFETRLIERGYDIKLVQSLLGHADIRTTEIYLHVVRNTAGAIRSPVDTD
ncbi:MAG: integron integrase [Pseudomonadota bacterium]